MKRNSSALILDSVDQSAVRLSLAIGRRDFLRKLGALGLMSGLAFAGFSLQLAGPAAAAGSCAGGACGPSPLCSGGCSGSNCGSNQNRHYNLFHCDSHNNSWSETYCPGCATPGNWVCGDCCQSGGSGDPCDDGGCSGASPKACICRNKVGNFC